MRLEEGYTYIQIDVIIYISILMIKQLRFPEPKSFVTFTGLVSGRAGPAIQDS